MTIIATNFDHPGGILGATNSGGGRYTTANAFTVDQATRVVALRLYAESANVNDMLALWRASDGAVLALVPISTTADGWQQVTIPTVSLSPGVEYRVGSVNHAGTRYYSPGSPPNGANVVGHKHDAGLPVTFVRSYVSTSNLTDTSMPTLDSNGTSEWVNGLVFDTNEPPATPGIPAVTPLPVNTTGTISWSAATDPNGDALTYEIDLSTDNGATWTSIAAGVSGTSLAYNFAGAPSSSAARLRIRAVDPSGARSAYATSGLFTIQHNFAPLAPTLSSPSNNQTVDRAVTQRFSWVFQDPDAGDTPSAYELHYRTGAGAWTTVNGITTSTFRDFPGSTFPAGAYEWQVRTYDAQGLPSLWSGSSFFTAIDAPAGPTITAPTNNSTVATADSVVSWSYPSQTAYQVRRVADVAGSPDTGTVYYDSGQISSATARNLPVTFETNSRFEHVQVRVQTDGLWSPWTSVRVQVSYTRPWNPTLVALALDALAAIQVSVTNATVNLLTAAQASAETDGSSGWNTDGSGTFARSTAQALDGTASYSLTRIGGAGEMYAYVSADKTPVIAGRTYIAVASFRAATVGRSVRIDVNWFDEAGSGVAVGTPGVYLPDNTTGWVQATVSAVAPAGATRASIAVVVSAGGSGEVHYVDKLGVFADAAAPPNTPYPWTAPRPVVVGVDLYRREAASTDSGIRIAKDISSSAPWLDYTPASGVAYAYKAVAKAINGTTADSAWTT